MSPLYYTKVINQEFLRYERFILNSLNSEDFHT